MFDFMISDFLQGVSSYAQTFSVYLSDVIGFCQTTFDQMATSSLAHLDTGPINVLDIEGTAEVVYGSVLNDMQNWCPPGSLGPQ